MTKREVPEGIMRSIMALDAEGKRTLLGGLKVLIAKDMAGHGADEGHPCCPRCGGAWVVRKGKTEKGKQRWFCRDCERSFGETTGSAIGLSRLPVETWMAYFEGMAEHRPLRELADRCGVCPRTSWHVRMRICEAMGRHLDAFVSGPDVSVEVDGTVLHESLKGNNGRGCLAVPREAHASGDSLHVRGGLRTTGERGLRGRRPRRHGKRGSQEVRRLDEAVQRGVNQKASEMACVGSAVPRV